jgi:hypothetical protein
METLYSLILWDKMGRKPGEYAIQGTPLKKIEKEFLAHIENVGSKKFEDEVQENSFMEIKRTDLFFDGHFYENTDSYHMDTVSQDPEDPSRIVVRQIYHESMVESTILTMMMKHLNPESVKFLANVHSKWYNQKANGK